jgi:hypothetical protein
MQFARGIDVLHGMPAGAARDALELDLVDVDGNWVILSPTRKELARAW